VLVAAGHGTRVHAKPSDGKLVELAIDLDPLRPFPRPLLRLVAPDHLS
jgi:hypothetical protein